MSFGLKEKNVLLISPEPWDFISVSKHHYALELAERGNDVFFLGPPGNGYHLSRPYEETLWVLDHPGFPRGFRFFPNGFQKKRIRKEFYRLESLAGKSFDLLWSFDDSVFFDMERIPERVLRILHIVDLSQNFHLDRAASTAHICFCTTRFIQDRLRPFNDRTFQIPHAYKPSPGDENVAPLPGGNSIKAVYGGNLSIPYLDWEVLYSCVEQHPWVDFVFFGPNAYSIDRNKNPTEYWKEQLQKFPNVFFPGAVAPSSLSAYYQKADVLLLAYREEFLEQVASPHKLLEYMASGKVIVATQVEELKHMKGSIRMTEENAAFPSLFKETIADLSFFNSREMVEARISAVRSETYEKRLQEIEGIISSIFQKR